MSFTCSLTGGLKRFLFMVLYLVISSAESDIQMKKEKQMYIKGTLRNLSILLWKAENVMLRDWEELERIQVLVKDLLQNLNCSLSGILVF